MTETFSYHQILALILAPLVSAALIRLLMVPAPAWGLIDNPGHRKVHQHPTLLDGGLGLKLPAVMQSVARRVISPYAQRAGSTR